MVNVEMVRSGINMSSGKLNFAKERRVRWSMYKNLDLSFNTWEGELLKHGFCEHDAWGLPHIPRDKLHQTLNFDEMNLLLHGSSIN